MAVYIRIKDIIQSVEDCNVGVLTNGNFWLEEAGDDLTGIVKGACRKLVVLYGEHGPRGFESGGLPSNQTFDHYLNCEVRNVSTHFFEDFDSSLIADLDLVIVGMTDIGCRHYTYKRTMCSIMEAASELKKRIVVVDFPNPVGGLLVEGNVSDFGYWNQQPRKYRSSPYFCAPIPYRHGMTIGELALLFKEYLQLDLDLEVIKLEGWKRNMYFEDTGYPYIPLDPSIHTMGTTIAYLCTGLFQGTSVSWGIGSGEPYHVIGAPWIDDDRFLDVMREHNIPGVTWSRAHFVPKWSKERGSWKRYAGELCNGVRLHITDTSLLRTARVQLTLMVELLRIYPTDFNFCVGDCLKEDFSGMNNRLDGEEYTDRLKKGEGVDTILCEWEEQSKEFEMKRKPFILY
jgi:uncharacterized protein YbbC (DUF1343 family)